MLPSSFLVVESHVSSWSSFIATIVNREFAYYENKKMKPRLETLVSSFKSISEKYFVNNTLPESRVSTQEGQLEFCLLYLVIFRTVLFSMKVSSLSSSLQQARM